MTDFDTIAPTVEAALDRAGDRFGRPLIKMPNGKSARYRRATTFASTLEDSYTLGQWKRRMVLLGAAAQPELLQEAAELLDDKSGLDRVCEQAHALAGGNERRDLGTALHKLTELLDEGVDVLADLRGAIEQISSIECREVALRHIDSIPADLRAYVEATRPLKHLHSETLVVLDDLKVAGTPDRITEYDGQRFICDLKTGEDLKYAQGTISIQLALYAHGLLYDALSGERSPLPSVNGQRGIVVHLRAGSGRCSLQWVNIHAGWQQIELANAVRKWRSRNDLFAPLDTSAAIDNLVAEGLVDDPITAQISAAANVEQLGAIWRDNRAAWTDVHTARAAERKALLITQEGKTA